MDHAEFDLLVDRHLDGGLDLATQDRLEALLRSDASLRTRFWDLARIHGRISWVAQERHADLPADEAVAADRALRDSSLHTPIARTSARRPTTRTIHTTPDLWRRVIPAAVAACVAVAAGFAWLSNNAPAPVQATTDAVIADTANAH
jgi:hypothetical protein